MAVHQPRVTVTNTVTVTITILTFFGMMPYALYRFLRHKILQTSIIGNIYLVFTTIHYSAQYHFETIENYDENNKDTGQLSILISMVILYMEPILMITDAFAFFVNQRRIIDLLNRMEKVNEKLIKQNIDVNLGRVRKISITLVSMVTVLEVGLVTYNYVVFKDAIWFIPLYLSGLSKVFYVTLVHITKEFFRGINNQLQATKVLFDENKIVKKQRYQNEVDTNEFGYLHKEIVTKRKMASKRKVIPSNSVEQVVKVIPYWDNGNFADCSPNEVADCNRPQPDKKLLSDQKPFYIDSTAMLVSDKLDKKIKKLCQIHDDICDIARRINRMFSIQMLILIAYGFMAITARIYFMYCSLVGQTIPLVFRAAESTTASLMYLMYTSAKCLVVVLISHNTRRVAQRTGIFLHKVAIAVDEDHLYETIAGAITSYIIILIQFNLAALRGKKPYESRANGTILFRNESLNLN